MMSHLALFIGLPLLLLVLLGWLRCLRREREWLVQDCATKQILIDRIHRIGHGGTHAIR